MPSQNTRPIYVDDDAHDDLAELVPLLNRGKPAGEKTNLRKEATKAVRRHARAELKRVKKSISSTA